MPVRVCTCDCHSMCVCVLIRVSECVTARGRLHLLTSVCVGLGCVIHCGSVQVTVVFFPVQVTLRCFASDDAPHSGIRRLVRERTRR